ncbi:MAG: hypothetical protein LUH01_17665 [Parabacteroides gordonii]|nr:hypothetical protein [Parabacteroides gordonii]
MAVKLKKDEKTTFSKEELDAYFEEKLKPFKEKAEQYDLEKKTGRTPDTHFQQNERVGLDRC